MNKVIARLLQLGIRALTRGEYARFEAALSYPRETQRALLQELLASQALTEYGQARNIDPEWSEAEFRARIPITDFDDTTFLLWNAKQKQSPEASILSPGGVKIFEKTSGSSGKQKLIPYNQKLLSSFERYFKIWVYDLLTRGPELESLRIFMSISPSFRKEEEIAQKVGFEDDSQYLSLPLRMALKLFLSVPLDIKSIQDPELFRDTLCAHLVSDQRLEIISVWHPSLMLVLWEHLLANRQRIAGIVQARNLKAAKLLRSNVALRPAMFWPELKLISAWESAQSALPAQRLKSLIPYAYFQGKGLLATEAPMTLPLLGHGSIPIITEVLFEFMDASGELHWIDELKEGQEYSLIISQKSGLLRYRMKDCVRAFATSVGTPRLEFIGRESDVSDLVGEKLSSGFVRSHESDFVQRHQAASYVILPFLPEGSELSHEKPRYIVLADAPSAHQEIASFWDERLSSAFHYDYARKLGQLAPVEARCVPGLQTRLLNYYVERKGMKAGDVKLSTLLNNPEESVRILNHMNVLAERKEIRV